VHGVIHSRGWESKIRTILRDEFRLIPENYLNSNLSNSSSLKNENDHKLDKEPRSIEAMRTERLKVEKELEGLSNRTKDIYCKKCGLKNVIELPIVIGRKYNCTKCRWPLI
jgi:hypothetical protein